MMTQTLEFNTALYRLPGDEHVSVSGVLKLEEWDDANPRTGFMLAPFVNDRILFLPGTPGTLFGPEEKPSTPRSTRIVLPDPDEAYVAAVSELIERLKVRGGKTVFSHIFTEKSRKTPMEIFQALSHAYPDAFVYLVQLAGSHDVWIGATPELLLEIDGRTLRTMALAGTRPAGSCGHWDEKNREEQRMVADFIVQALHATAVTDVQTDTRTLQAGPVEHICTDITARLPENYKLSDLLRRLAPTPAVAGLPRDAALRDIAELEGHDRGFYGGYCGPVTFRDSKLTLHLYVMLRLLRFDETTGICHIYAGGGITPRSNPEDEWREICNKSATLTLHL